MRLVLADPPCNTRSTREQSSSEHDVFSEKDLEEAVKMMSIAMALVGHGNVFCSDLRFFH